MNVLFIHQNFPGQFVHLAGALAREKGNRVVALTIHQQPVPEGVEVRPYKLLRNPVPETHFLLKETESKILRAEACAAAAMKLKHEGFEPDVIVAHPGWGEAMFIKDVLPSAKLVVYCEYYYAVEGQDVGFDPELPPINFAQRCQLRMKNTASLHSLDIADAAISPTEWQKSTYPEWAQKKIAVIHDGIDTKRLKYNPNAKVTVNNPASNKKIHFKNGDEVLTYIARNLEPIRGFHTFMRSLPAILRSRPNLHVLIVGGDDISYGHRAPDNLTWKEFMLKELDSQIDFGRVHFLGKIAYQDYVDVLHVSKVHVYLTAPFVLSWSFLEAAASGVKIIASDTPPVQEFAEVLNVKTVPFFDVEKFSRTVIRELELPLKRQSFSSLAFSTDKVKSRTKEFIKALVNT